MQDAFRLIPRSSAEPVNRETHGNRFPCYLSITGYRGNISLYIKLGRLAHSHMNAVKQLEDRLLPCFRDFAAHLRATYPAVKAHVHSLPEGRLTEWHGHNVCIDCVLPDVPPERPGNIELSVCVFHLTRNPMVSAHVVWGHPSGMIVDELAEQPIPFSDAALSDLEDALPRLTQSLESAIRRGAPET